MYKYAQIDSNNICFAVSYLSGEVIADDMIMLNEEDEPLGMKYKDGIWEEVPKPEPEPTELEKTQLDIIQENTEKLLVNESALDVLLGVNE